MDTRKRNMEYLGLNNEQYDKHIEIMDTPMNKWDKSLMDYVVNQGKAQGFVNGDSMAVWVAEWIKTLSQD